MAVYGPPGNEELYHWKYIRKYKKNGKWRYVYPNDKLGIKEAISTKITGKAQDQHLEELTLAKSRIAEDDNRQRLKLGDAKAGDFKTQEKIKSNIAVNKALSNKMNKQIAEVRNSRYDTVVSEANRTITAGKNAIDSLINKLKKKMR